MKKLTKRYKIIKLMNAQIWPKETMQIFQELLKATPELPSVQIQQKLHKPLLRFK